MPSFKPPKPHDDQERIRSDRAHDVVVGKKAKVSLGGMASAVVKVTATGKDGITTVDAKGRAYRFLWAHVHGPASDDDELDDAKAAATHGEPLAKALTAIQKPLHRALYAGDSIYFSDSAGQAQHGTVAAVGKHGATVDCQDDDGKSSTHQVRHSAIVGHRKRAERKLIIIDRGEDGSICADESGKRVFVRGNLGEIKEQQLAQEMTKALTSEYQLADDARIIATDNAALAPILSAMAAMQQNHQQALDRFAGLVAAAIGKPLPAINIQTPERPAPNVQVDVHVPEQAAPVINFAPAVSVNTPEQQIVSIVSMPERRTEAVVERDKDGNLKSSVQIEKDSA